MKKRESGRGMGARVASRAGRVDAGFAMEAFEARTLMDAVAWDGGAGTSNWNDAANWNRNGVDALPQNGDDVTISVVANPTINFSSGTLTLNSLTTNEALTITGGTLGVTGAADINAVMTLQGGTASGGTWDVTGGTLRGSTSGGTLSNMNIVGDILLDSTSAIARVSGTTRFGAARLSGNGSTLQAAPGYVLHDLVQAEGATAGSRSFQGAVGASGTLTISPTGVVRLAAGAGGALTISNSSVVTLLNQGLISAEAAGRTLSINVTNATNSLTMRATAGTLDVTPTNLTNQGALTATGGTLIVGGAWTNTGTISATDGALSLGGNWPAGGTISAVNCAITLGGSFTSAGLSGFTRTGGAVTFTGTMNNTGNTFTFNAATGSWSQQGGEVTGGTIVFTAQRLVPTSSGGGFTDVQINGDVLLDTTSAITRVGGTTRFNAVRLAANASTVQFSPGYVLSDLVVAEGAASGSRGVQGAVGGPGSFTIAPGGSIRLAAGAGGNLTISNSSVLTLINNGTILAEAASRTLSVNNTTVTNNASMQATAGTLDVTPANLTNAGTITGSAGTTVNVGGVWTNSGTISVTSGTLTLSGTYTTLAGITAINSTVNLGGTFTSAGFASFARTGGTVNFTGTMNNTGTTFTFDATTGSWNQLGGTVIGGTLEFVGGNRLVPSSSGGGYTDVQINADVLMDVSSASLRIAGTTRFGTLSMTGGSTSLQFAPGYVLEDDIAVSGVATGSRSIQGAVGGSGTLTISPSGSIQLLAGAGGNLSISNSSLLTLINQGLISNAGAGRTLSVQTTGFTNQAQMQATGGSVLTISPTSWSNVGSVSASASTLNLEGTWTNAGTITSNLSTLNLGGTFPTPIPGAFSRTGGSVNITGTMNNAGNTLVLDDAFGSWTLSGGTVTGGTINVTGVNRLLTSTSGGSLIDVIYNADLLLDVSNVSVRVGGSTRFFAARLSASGVNLQAAAGFILNDLISVEGPASGTRSIQLAVGGSGTVTVGATGIIRLAPGAGANLSITNSSISTLVNNGLISVEAAGRTLTIQNSTFTNNGALQVSDGTLAISSTNWTNAGSATATGGTLTLEGNWSSTGTITSSNAVLNLGGTFTAPGAGAFTRTGGTLNLTGTMNNAANTFTLNDSTGSMVMSGGTIVGGVVNYAGANRLLTSINGGTLLDVDVNGEILVDGTSASIRAAGAAHFDAVRLLATNASFSAAPGFTLLDSVIAEGAVTGARSITLAVGGSGTVAIGATGVIRLAAGCGGNLSISNSSISTLVNNGLISAEAAGRTLTIQNSTFTNAGTLQALAGTLSVSPTTWSNPGAVIATNASVTLDGAWSSTGSVITTDSTVTLAGTFTTAGIGVFTRTGGVVNLTGTMNNAASTVTFNAASGSWNLSGGTVNGGSLVFTGGAALVATINGGSLNDVQVQGEIVIDATSASMRFVGSTRFSAVRLVVSNAGANFGPGYVLRDPVTVEGPTVGNRSISFAVGGVGTATIASTGSIRVLAGSGGGLSISNSSVATLVNEGLISNEAAGRTITINTTSFTNNGTVQALAGTLSIAPTTFTNYAKGVLTGGTYNAFGPGIITMPAGTNIVTANANIGVGNANSFPAVAGLATVNGTLSARGTGSFAITPTGGTLTTNGTVTLAPGNVVTVNGSYTQAPGTNFVVEIQGTGAADIGRMVVTGTGTVQGNLQVVGVNNYNPDCVNSVFFTAGTQVGQFVSQSLPTPPGDHQALVVYIGGEIRFAISPPSDYNEDGILNSQDLFDFLTDFFANNADFNADGVTNSQDFFDFITDFFEGCG